MKKRYFYFFILIVGLIAACRNEVNNPGKRALFDENPVTIRWNSKKGSSIDSFQANVQIHTMNNRTDTHAKLQETYHLSIKTIGERILTRIDFPADQKYDIAARSIITDGKEVIVFDPNTEVIEKRLMLNDDVDSSLQFLKPETVLSRVNLKFIRSEASRLALDMQEDTETGLFVLNLPPALLSKNNYEKLLSSRICFDMNSEILQEVENVYIQEDGTKITSKTNIVYEEKDGVPVKVGSFTEIDVQNPNKIEVVSEGTVIYDSADDVPEITAEKLAELQQNGEVIEKKDMTFGDPGDLSYKETVIELYEDIKINEADDSLFKLLL